MVRKIVLSALFAVAVLSGGADALTYLPDSLYADEVGNWQGNQIRDEGDGYKLMIEYTVYDSYDSLGTVPLAETDEVDLVTSLGLEGRYIYMYQIFNHTDPEQTGNIGSFSVLDLDESSMAGRTMDDTGSYESDVDGIEPENYPSEGVWQFGGFGLEHAQHSWFMTFSSDFAPIVGTYEINTVQPDIGVPPVPEPATLTMLGIGSAMILRRRRKS